MVRICRGGTRLLFATHYCANNKRQSENKTTEVKVRQLKDLPGDLVVSRDLAAWWDPPWPLLLPSVELEESSYPSPSLLVLAAQ